MSSVVDVDFSIGEYKTQCPQCASVGNDNSCNNLHVYGSDNDGNKLGAYCFACSFAIPSDEFKESGGNRVSEGCQQINDRDLVKFGEKRLSREEVNKIVDETSSNPKGWRGLQEKYLKGLNIRFVHDSDGNPVEMLTGVTYTKNNKTEIVGFKSRKFPKDFSSPKGYTGHLADLIGYKKAKSQKRVLVITEGEVDFASAHQMYQMDMESKGRKYELPSVVSTLNGINSLLKSFRDSNEMFNFFKQYEKVVLAVDNDEVGSKYVDEFIEAMPRETLYRANLRYKDANDYLVRGAIHEWVSDTYWNATPCSVASIVGSGDWLSSAQEELKTKRLELPNFISGVNSATRGGLPMGRYVIFAGASSIGKTVFVNSMIYDWIIKDTHKIGVVSLELSKGQYYVEMLSRHAGINIDDIEDNEKRYNILDDNPELIDLGNEFFRREDGSDRFHVVDDRDSDIAKIQEMCEELVVKHGVQVVVLDPISDINQRLDNQQQVVFNSWIKSFIKKYNILIIGISHVKKGDKDYDKGDIPDEGDLIGSYSNSSSAAAIFFLSRNKMSDDPIIRNTTVITTPKIRWTGRTGIVDKVYFDQETRRLYNFSDYFSGNVDKENIIIPKCLGVDDDDAELPDW